MKKYFSFIAVAMLAVSSVFTSCSKDDAGSSDIDTNSSKTTDVAGDTYQFSIRVGSLTENKNETATDSLLNDMQTFLQQKVGSTAKVNVGNPLITFTTSSATDTENLKKILKTITDSDIDAITTKYSTIAFLYTTFTIDDDKVLDYRYFIKTGTIKAGTWKATVDGTSYQITVTDKEVDTRYHKYEATLTVGSTVIPGTVNVYGDNYMSFRSDDKTDRDVAHYNLGMEFTEDNDDTFTASYRVYTDTQFSGVTFTK